MRDFFRRSLTHHTAGTKLANERIKNGDEPAGHGKASKPQHSLRGTVSAATPLASKYRVAICVYGSRHSMPWSGRTSIHGDKKIYEVQ